MKRHTYVLDHFQVEAPKLLSDLRVQVKDVELRNIEKGNQEVFPSRVRGNL